MRYSDVIGRAENNGGCVGQCKCKCCYGAWVMKSEIELPAEVVAEIEANRKVAAIKLLRKRMGIGLKEAKELVDAYTEKNPPVSTPIVAKTDTGIGRIIILIIGVSAIYGLYKFLT